MVNYSNGKVYKIEPICEHSEGDVYYGSTTKEYLSQRFDDHRGKFNRKTGMCKSTLLFEKYGVENCAIILLESVDATTKDELLAVEAKYIINNKCVNKCVPLRTRKEYGKIYYDDNTEKINEQKKIYRDANKDKIKEQHKIYRDANKDTIQEYAIKNAEKLKEYHKIYNDANTEKIKEQTKLYYEANKDTINEKNKMYYDTNKDKISEKRKIYRDNNKDKIKEKDRQRYLKKKEQSNAEN